MAKIKMTEKRKEFVLAAREVLGDVPVLNRALIQ